MIKNTENHYGIIAKLFHWLIAVAIISLITVGFIMSDMSPSPDKYELYGMHKLEYQVFDLCGIKRYSFTKNSS